MDRTKLPHAAPLELKIRVIAFVYYKHVAPIGAT
jgi:hypothetical protein